MRCIAFVSAGIAFVSADTNANLTAMNAKGTKSIHKKQVKAITIIKATDFIDVDSLNGAVYRVCVSWYRVCVQTRTCRWHAKGT